MLTLFYRKKDFKRHVAWKFIRDFYAQQHPEPEDILLLIEVSDSTLALDRKVKLPLYAKAGVVETWLVNLMNKQVEVYINPVDGKYQQKQIFKREEQLLSLCKASSAIRFL